MTEKNKATGLSQVLRQRKELDEMIDSRFKRDVAILFTDIVGSTLFFSTRGDIDGRLMIQQHNDLLTPLVARHRGQLIKIIGDALMASFEAPADAVACAVSMQEALAAYNQRQPTEDQIQIRIGINAGSGFVEESDVYGEVVNIAERIKSLAGGRQIFISESVYRSLQPGRDPLCAFLDKVQVKGKESEIKIYQVMWQSGEETSLRTRRESKIEDDLILEVSRENAKVKVTIYELTHGGERTLLPYEDQEVNWEQVEAGCREIVGLLNRANKRAKVTAEILDGLKKTSQVLFDVLMPPKAREKIGSTAAKNLILYVDDQLVHIPWELLFNGRDFLCRRFAMGRIVSTRQAPTSQTNRKLTTPFNVLILADPRGDLEASYREGTEIRNFLDDKRESFHVDFKSHPIDTGFAKKNLRDYDIVHYAGHADYDEKNPSDSGWLLDGGRLKASEISAMGGLRPMPALVFSNACQTGRTGEWHIQAGYEQQIFGLANAYLLSGVRHYIGTFWEILDEPSSYFAKRFYNFLAQGERVGEALRRARIELIDAYGEETIVWASYMLYGDPTFEFVSAEKEIPRESVAPQRAPADWPQVMRGEPSAPNLTLPVEKPRTVNVPAATMCLIAAVLVGILGWSLFRIREEAPPIAPIAASNPLPPTEPAAETAKLVDTTKKPVAVTPATENPSTQKKETKVAAAVTIPVAIPLATSESKAVQPSAIELAKKEIVPPPTPVAAGPLTLSMNLIGQRKESDGTYTEVVVNEGSVLRSYDNFQVNLETSRPAYVYILLYDSQGLASPLFPDAKINQLGFVEAGRKVAVPGRDLWFWLDEHPGTETIYVLASEQPMTDIRGLLARMQGGSGAAKQNISVEIKQRIEIVQRGVGGITKGQAVTYTLSDGKKIQKVTDVVTGTGSVVRAVSFQHR